MKIFYPINCLIFLLCFGLSRGQENNSVGNPFEKFEYNEAKIVTLSQGKYAEFHDDKDIVKIGSFLYNTRSKTIVDILEETEPSKGNKKTEITSRFMSIDPLFREYAFYSPYSYSGNRVIDMIELEGLEPKSVVVFDLATLKYKFTKPAVHLLSLVSGVSGERISETMLIPRSGPLRAPLFSINSDGSGGGAMTVYDRIVYTENFFEGKYESPLGILPWLSLSSHEVGHLPQSDEYSHNLLGKLSYMVSFAKDYMIGFLATVSTKEAHDTVKRENEADKGKKEFIKFNNYINKNFGEGQLRKLFQNEEFSDEDKIERIDFWYQNFQLYGDSNNKGRSEMEIEDNELSN